MVLEQLNETLECRGACDNQTAGSPRSPRSSALTDTLDAMATDSQPEVQPEAPPKLKPGDYERVCALSELPPGARRCLQLPSSGRVVMLLNVRGTIYCMDQACYRASASTSASRWPVPHGAPVMDDS
jgi:hypothetical protein